MRAVVLVLSMLLVTGCVAAAEPDEPAHARELDDLEDRLREISRMRAAVDAELEAGLMVLGEIDGMITAARSPSRAGTALATVEERREDLEDLDPSGLREDLRTLAATIDDTRARLEVARAASDGWRQEYLGAQDAVLSAVREHAAACDALVQLVDRHRTTYDTVLERLAGIEDEAERDPEGEHDLASQVEVALSGRLEAVALAQEELATYTERREATARAVNEATADAAAVFDRRPGS